jgi:hypothetical protein
MAFSPQLAKGEVLLEGATSCDVSDAGIGANLASLTLLHRNETRNARIVSVSAPYQ